MRSLGYDILFPPSYPTNQTSPKWEMYTVLFWFEGQYSIWHLAFDQEQSGRSVATCLLCELHLRMGTGNRGRNIVAQPLATNAQIRPKWLQHSQHYWAQDLISHCPQPNLSTISTETTPLPFQEKETTLKTCTSHFENSQIKVAQSSHHVGPQFAKFP